MAYREERPVMNNQVKVIIPDVNEYLAQKIDGIDMGQGSTEAGGQRHKIKFPTKEVYGDVTLSVMFSENGNSNAPIYQWLADKDKKTVIVRYLNLEGEEVGGHTLRGCFPKNIKTSTADLNADGEPLMNEVTLSVDEIEYNAS